MESQEKMTIEMVDSTFARFQVGKLVKGTVVLIRNEGALINIGGIPPKITFIASFFINLPIMYVIIEATKVANVPKMIS